MEKQTEMVCAVCGVTDDLPCIGQLSGRKLSVKHHPIDGPRLIEKEIE